MKIAYFDCIAGASGDMILGALIDAGLSLEKLQSELAALDLPGFELQANRVNKNGFSAVKLEVIITDHATERHLAEINELVTNSRLPVAIQQQAIAIFQRLGEVEAGIHAASLDHVHLHELGGLDTIVDVTGALLGLHLLGIEQVYSSPLPLGRGFIHGAHGNIPLPAPATLALLQGTQVVGSDIEKELVTPTGAALLSSLAKAFGPIPAMRLQAVGYGAGGRDLPIPNLLRVLIGEQVCPAQATLETLALIETNIDNQNPELYSYLMERLFTAGALDVTYTPIQMKKNRPATQVSVLCYPEKADQMENILFSETGTLGLRRSYIERRSLKRESRTVETPYGLVRVKLADWGGSAPRVAPEYEDCRNLAEQTGSPLWQIYQAAINAFSSL